MNLTKEQTFEIFKNKARLKSVNMRYIFTTKTKAECITCGTQIFVSYRNFRPIHIFCKDCVREGYSKPTTAQAAYKPSKSFGSAFLLFLFASSSVGAV